MTNLDRILACYARYGTAGVNELLRRMGITLPAGAVEKGGKEDLVAKWGMVADAAEAGAKFAGVKGALLAGDGDAGKGGKGDAPQKGTAPVSMVVLPESTDVAAKLAHALDVQRLTQGQLRPSDPNAAPGSSPANSRPLSRIDQLLASPWTDAELRELATGPRIVIEPDPSLTFPYAQGMLDSVKNKLRAAMAIRFDSPVPILGTWTLWDYIKRTIGTIRLWGPLQYGTNNNRNPQAILSERAIEMQSDPGPPVWSHVQYLTLLVHEGRHLEAPHISHSCSNGIVCANELDLRRGTCPPGHSPPFFQDDPSLEYGGAYAADYWGRRWLAEHSGDWLSPADREAMAASAMQLLTDQETGPFCNRRNYPGHPATEFDPHPPPPR